MKKDGGLCMIACSIHPFCDPWKKSPVLIVNEPRLTVRMQRIIEMMVRT
jgi:hypothetical protein